MTKASASRYMARSDQNCLMHDKGVWRSTRCTKTLCCFSPLRHPLSPGFLCLPVCWAGTSRSRGWAALRQRPGRPRHWAAVCHGGRARKLERKARCAAQAASPAGRGQEVGGQRGRARFGLCQAWEEGSSFLVPSAANLQAKHEKAAPRCQIMLWLCGAL